MSTLKSVRQEVLLKIASNGKVPIEPMAESPSAQFGINTFNEKVMREYLPKDVCKKLLETIKDGKKLDQSISDTVAHAMKEWAISKGVSHFTHWFQPQTGLTAEKHDAFIEVDENGVIERFKGSSLVQGEPDASSFPSGGSRTTFEARGYSMWDPSSPAFIVEGPKGGILCIPSVFISYTGEALDKKTPLLRSMDAISDSALKILKLFGNKKSKRVITTIGSEQEYFLVDKSFYALRPDLQITGRTLVGAKPPKGQQLDDHYFGSIKERVLAFMQDTESELYKLGVPAKTRHNEVAPHQYELASIFSEANVASDRNQISMEILKKIANRHGLALLLHEKPFAGVNGSGKHNNWSIADSEGNNLLDPGETPEENLQFLVFLVSVLQAVKKYSVLLRMAVASASNDHRLGANEAPPAIMSVFLGAQLDAILNSIKEKKTPETSDQYIIDLGLNKLPSIMRDNTDRNRTSPFAFTGEKFEFRALGSSASVALTNTLLSAAVADSIDIIHDEIQAKLSDSKNLKDAVIQVLHKYVIETESIRFEGNNYSAEWEKEAEKRGLPNIKRTGYAFDGFIHPENMAMLERQKVFNKVEIEGRYNIKLEQYITTLEIEADTLINLINTRVLPSAFAYQEKLLSVVKNGKALADVVGAETFDVEVSVIKSVSDSVKELKSYVSKMEDALAKAEEMEDLPKKAKFFSDIIVDLINETREPADKLEALIPDDLWTLPKYQEMLFFM